MTGTKGNVITFTYSSESEQFTGHDAFKLDEWVFERFERFIRAAPHNSTLSEMLQKRQLIFFFHLLGLDTNGHTNKPHSTYSIKPVSVDCVNLYTFVYLI